MTTKIPLWIDCDPGHDDAIAMLIGSQLPYFDLLGVSTVYGNASLAHTTNNALALLDAFKLQDSKVEIYPGADKPLQRPQQYAPDVHGESGLDGTDLLPKTPTKLAQPAGSAVGAMAAAIEAHPGQIAIVATGTLTNIAQLVLQRPDLLPQIRQVGIMGGGVKEFNWSHDAEFNIWCDPHAADLVLANPVLAPKTFLVPLDMTHKAIATAAVCDKVRGDGSHPTRQMLYELLKFFGHTYLTKFDFKDGPPVHDPCAVAVLLPEYFPEFKDKLAVTVERADIEVGLDDEHLGRTLLARPNETAGVRVVLDMNVDAFWTLVLDSLDILDRK